MADLKSNLALVKGFRSDVESVVAERDALKAAQGTPTIPSPVSGVEYADFAPLFAESFDTDECAEGGFVQAYGAKWDPYPNGWKDTSKKGNYNPGILSVNNGVMTCACTQLTVCSRSQRRNPTSQEYGPLGQDPQGNTELVGGSHPTSSTPAASQIFSAPVRRTPRSRCGGAKLRRGGR